MFRTASLSLLVTALAAVPVLGQKTLQAFSGPGERVDTNHLIAVMEGGKFTALAGAAFVSYVPAEWTPALDNAGKVDELTKGHLFRLGKNNWATLDNNVPISFGNVTVPPGIWYLGIARDKEGSKWTLVFVDPAKAKAQGIVPPMADQAPRSFEVVLPVEKASDAKKTMSVVLQNDAKEAAKGTLSIAFGNMKASVNYELKIAPIAEASSPKK
jgi:hypothetical protein